MVAFLNIGNTCYFNVVLQILLHLKAPKKRTLSLDTEKCANWLRILKKLQNLKKEKVFDPTLIFSFLNWDDYFDKGKPHDAHEALLKIIDLAKYTCFQGQILDIMTTNDEPFEHHCKNTEFTTIDLTISKETIEDCFANYFRTERITEWKDKNSNDRTLIKFQCILKFPENLIVLLKQDYHRKHKLVYKRTLVLSDFSASTQGTVEYNLKSVVIHRSAHYYVYCLENNKWFLYNDDERDQVRCTANWVPSEPPYMLVYGKV